MRNFTQIRIRLSHMTELAERIKKIRKRENLTQAKFAMLFVVHRGHISNIETGAAKPSEKILRGICDYFAINYKWLTTGEGEMDQDWVTGIFSDVPEWIVESLTGVDIKELEEYRESLSPEELRILAYRLIKAKNTDNYLTLLKLLGRDIEYLVDNDESVDDDLVKAVLWRIINRLEGWDENDDPYQRGLSEIEKAVLNVLGVLDLESKKDIYALLASKGERFPGREYSNSSSPFSKGLEILIKAASGEDYD